MLQRHRSQVLSIGSCPSTLDSSRRDASMGQFEGQKHIWIFAAVSYPPVINDVGVWFENGRRKCQQKCQQTSTRVARGKILTIPPASMVNTSIGVPKGRGEGRRFRPSPPFKFPRKLAGFPSKKPPKPRLCTNLCTKIRNLAVPHLTPA